MSCCLVKLSCISEKNEAQHFLSKRNVKHIYIYIYRGEMFREGPQPKFRFGLYSREHPNIGLSQWSE